MLCERGLACQRRGHLHTVWTGQPGWSLTSAPRPLREVPPGGNESVGAAVMISCEESALLG